jgi:hypothetical protein
MLAALALPGSLRAQGNFVYTNDDILGPNTVSGFSVAPNGALTLLSGSPFSTGGTGYGWGYFGVNRITVSTVGNFLFASNTTTNDVSVFRINGRTGALTRVGSPFAVGGVGTSAEGIGLAVTPDGKFLMASRSSYQIMVFSIAGSGALSLIPHSPFTTLGQPVGGMKVSRNGKFLAVSEWANQIEMFSIAADGSLTSLGAFPGKGSGNLSGVDVDCTSRLLYGSEEVIVTGKPIVDGYSISRTGTLTALPGSPFEPGVGVYSTVVLLGYGVGWKSLFVSDTLSPAITVFRVAANGGLSLVAGSPFPMNSGDQPAGMATSQDGSLLYMTNYNNKVSVFRVGNGGALTEVAGSPFLTGQSGALLSLTAFPPRQLSLLEALLDGCPVDAHSGFFSPGE